MEHETDKYVPHIQDHKELLNDNKHERRKGAAKVGELELVLALLEGEHKSNKSSAVEQKWDNGVVSEGVMHRGVYHEVASLVLKVRQHRLAVEQKEARSEEYQPVVRQRGMDAASGSDGITETEYFAEHANLHGDDGNGDPHESAKHDQHKGNSHDEGAHWAQEEVGRYEAAWFFPRSFAHGCPQPLPHPPLQKQRCCW
jgi:hypothetical protein